MKEHEANYIEMLLICKAAFEGFFKKDNIMFAEMMADMGEFICQFDEPTRQAVTEELLFSLSKNAAEGIELADHLPKEEKSLLKFVLFSFTVLDKGDNAELVVLAEQMIDEELESFEQIKLDEAKKNLLTRKYGHQLKNNLKEE